MPVAGAQSILANAPPAGSPSMSPEFGDVLKRKIYWLAGRKQTGDALDGHRVARMSGLCPAQQDIGINEDAHPRLS